MKVQVLGIGNSILADDSAGLRVIEAMREDVAFDDCILTDGGTGGLGIIDLLEACDRLILVDAFVTGAEPGTIHTLEIDDLNEMRSVHLSSAHGFDFAMTMELFRQTEPEKAPESIVIYGIEAKDVTIFSEACSEEVAAAVQEVVAIIRESIL